MGKKQTIIALLMLILLIASVSAQFGGGRGGASSRSRRSRTSKPLTPEQHRKIMRQHQIQFIKRWVRSIQQWLYGRQKEKKFQEHYYQYQAYYQFPLTLLWMGAFILFVQFIHRFHKAATLHSYEVKFNSSPCKLTQEECETMIKKIKTSIRRMIINFKDRDKMPIQCDLSEIKLKMVSDQIYKYDIQMKGNDIVGISSLYGRLIFTQKGVGVKLFKLYVNSKRARQTGSYSELLYEGFTEDCKEWSGTWAFTGHETKSKYSGTWFINTQKP